jgi:hypothetical protein
MTKEENKALAADERAVFIPDDLLRSYEQSLNGVEQATRLLHALTTEPPDNDSS